MQQWRAASPANCCRAGLRHRHQGRCHFTGVCAMVTNRMRSMVWFATGARSVRAECGHDSVVFDRQLQPLQQERHRQHHHRHQRLQHEGFSRRTLRQPGNGSEHQRVHGRDVGDGPSSPTWAESSRLSGARLSSTWAQVTHSFTAARRGETTSPATVVQARIWTTPIPSESQSDRRGILQHERHHRGWRRDTHHQPRGEEEPVNGQLRRWHAPGHFVPGGNLDNTDG